VVIADVKIDEIRNAMAQDAIKYIAHGAAQNERQTGLAKPATGAASDEKPGEQGNNRYREKDQQRREEWRTGIGEKAEGYTGVAGVNQIQHAGNQDAQRSGGRKSLDGVLCRLVREQDSQ